MARPMEFDRDEAIARAVDAFWECGFGTISANELAERMGIAKSSFYNTFGSKTEVLREAITCYTVRRSALLQEACSNRYVLEVLRKLLVDIANRNDDGKGCLLVNTAIELSRHEAYIADLTRIGFDTLIKTFAALIVVGQQAGEVRDDLDAKEQALIVVSGIAGIRVMAKSGFSVSEMNPFIDKILDGMAR